MDKIDQQTTTKYTKPIETMILGVQMEHRNTTKFQHLKQEAS